MPVLILESLDKGDPGSEGRFLTHMLNLMKVENQYIEIRTRRQLVELLRVAPKRTSIIHLTTHGCLNDANGGFVGLWTPSHRVAARDLSRAGVDLSGKVVISTACKSGARSFSRVFLDATNCDHYIAPRKSPRFHNSILFAHLFYHKHLILRRPVKEAFEEYAKRYKNPHDFCLISRSGGRAMRASEHGR